MLAMRDGFRYEIVGPQNEQEAIQLARRIFFKHEKICKALGLLDDAEAEKESTELLTATISDGVSMVAIDEATGKVIGAALNKLEVAGDPIGFLEAIREKCTREASLALLDFMLSCDEIWKPFVQYGVDCVMEVVFLSVDEAYWGRGIATELFQKSIELAQSLKNGTKQTLRDRPVPKMATAIFTSPATQKIGRKLGLEKTIEMDVKEFDYKDGSSYRDLIPEHELQTITFEAVRL